MQAKLTLRIENSLIKAAKEYSRIHNKSLSQLIANYFLSITQDEFKHNSQEMPPITRSLKGILRNKKVSKKDYLTYIEDKYR